MNTREHGPSVERPPPRTALLSVEKALLQFYQWTDLCVLNRRQRACLRTIRRRSFDRGEARTEVLDLNYFVEDNSTKKAGFDKSEASRGIDELEAMRIIAAPAKAAGERRPAGWYGINVLWGAWKVELKQPSERLEQRQLELHEPDLNDALRQTFISFDNVVPNAPQRMDAVSFSRSEVPKPDRDSNTAQALASGNAATSILGCVGNGSHPGESDTPRGLMVTGIPGAVQVVRGEIQNESTSGAVQTVGKIPTASGCWDFPNSPAIGAVQLVGKIPTTPARPGKHWVKPVGKIPTVPENGAENGGQSGAPERFPPHTPLSKALNVERLNVKRSALNARAKLSMEWEKELMDHLTAWLGAEEMKRFGGMWLSRWVRNVPFDVESEIRWGQQLEKQEDQNKPRNRAKWLMSRLCLIAHVSCVSEMPLGKVPES